MSPATFFSSPRRGCFRGFDQLEFQEDGALEEREIVVRDHRQYGRRRIVRRMRAPPCCRSGRSCPRNSSTGPSTSARGEISATAIRRSRIAMPLSTAEPAFEQDRRSPDGSTAQSLMSNSSRRRTANSPGVGPPMMKALRLPAASRPRSEKAIRAPASFECRAARTPSASSPLLLGSLEIPGGTGIGSARASTPALGEIEADDAIDPLDADIEHAILLGERFGIEPASRGQRPPVRAEHRRHLASAMPAGRPRSQRMRPVSQCARSLIETKRSPSASTRNAEKPPKSGCGDDSSRPPRNSAHAEANPIRSRAT